jgi:hypothetical protein
VRLQIATVTGGWFVFGPTTTMSALVGFARSIGDPPGLPPSGLPVLVSSARARRASPPAGSVCGPAVAVAITLRPASSSYPRALALTVMSWSLPVSRRKEKVSAKRNPSREEKRMTRSPVPVS